MSDDTAKGKKKAIKNSGQIAIRNEKGQLLPGAIINPHGRPRKGNSIADCMREYLAAEVTMQSGDKKTRREAFVHAVYASAMKGNVAAITQIWDHIDGKAPQRTKNPDEDAEKTEFALWQIENTCFDKQIDVLRNKKKRILIRCPRRSGKTELLARIALKAARARDDAHVTYFGLTQDRARQLLWKPIIDIAEAKHIPIDPDGTRGTLKLENESVIQFAGNDNIRDREKRQGDKNDVVIIDEAQSQQGLKYLIETIMDPTLADCDGTLVIAGSEPRIPDTYFDYLWGMDNDMWGKFKWTMFDNPFMIDPKKWCEDLLKSYGWTADEPTYRREYLGDTVFDDDALVLRFTAENYYTEDELSAWISKQPSGDVFCFAGLDIGFADPDALCIMLGSKSDDMIWSVYEEEATGHGTEATAHMVRDALAKVMQTRILYETPLVIVDMGENSKIAYDLRNTYRINCAAAVKHDREASIRIAEDRTHNKTLRIKRDGALDKECKKLLHVRNERDQVTGEISDDYHPNIFDALIYGLRYVHNRAGKLG